MRTVQRRRSPLALVSVRLHHMVKLGVGLTDWLYFLELEGLFDQG